MKEKLIKAAFILALTATGYGVVKAAMLAEIFLG
jgi:hypothetical protein